MSKKCTINIRKLPYLPLVKMPLRIPLFHIHPRIFMLYCTGNKNTDCKSREEYFIMTGILNFLIVAFMCIVGVVPSLYLLFAIPAVIGYKIHRKIRYGIALTN